MRWRSRTKTKGKEKSRNRNTRKGDSRAVALKIRLARHGKKGRPFYRIVVADATMRRDGRFLELVGTYDTLTDPPTINLKEERIKHWIGVGARPSDTTQQIIDKTIPGYLGEIEKKQDERIRSHRAKRKVRLKARLQAKK